MAEDDPVGGASPAMAQPQDMPRSHPQAPRPEPQQAVAGVPRLFVGQMPADRTEADIRPVFEAHGAIEKITLVRGPEKKSKGCAFVQFARWADAEQAVQAINGTSPFGGDAARPLVVHFANPRRAAGAQGSEPAIAARKLFVGQMPKSATEAELGALFAAFGEVERVTVLESRGMHAGCAFVQFARWAACEAAIAALHEQHLMAGAEHPLVVKFADAKRSDAGAPLGGKRAGGGEGRGGLPAGMRSQPEMMLMHPGAHAGYYLGPEAAHHLSMQHAAAMGHRHPQHAQHAHHMGLAMGPPPQRGGLGGLPGGRLRRGGAGSGTGGSSDSLADHASGSDASDNLLSLAPLSGSMMSLTDGGIHSPASTASGGAPAPPPAAALHAMAAAATAAGGMGMPGMGFMTPEAHQAMQMMHAAAMAQHQAFAQQQHQHYAARQRHASPPGPGRYPPGPPRAVKVGRGVSDPSVYAHKLFIGQVPFEAEEGDLWHWFAPLGEVLELAVLRAGGRSKGCAFLTLGTRQQALGAIAVLNGREVAPGKRLVVKFADARESKAAPPPAAAAGAPQ